MRFEALVQWAMGPSRYVSETLIILFVCPFLLFLILQTSITAPPSHIFLPIVGLIHCTSSKSFRWFIIVLIFPLHKMLPPAAIYPTIVTLRHVDNLAFQITFTLSTLCYALQAVMITTVS